MLPRVHRTNAAVQVGESKLQDQQEDGENGDGSSWTMVGGEHGNERGRGTQ